MTTIYLVRHAEAEGNAYRRIHGQYNSKITPNGLKQIEALRARFAPIAVDACYASDLYRTCKTAQAVYAAKKLPLHPEKRLRETGLGRWEDVPFGYLERFEKADMDAFNRTPQTWHVDGSETWEEYTGRFLQALHEIAARHDGQTVALFTHACVLRGAQMRLFAGQELPFCENTAVSRLRWQDGVVTADFLNDASHLTPEISTSERQKRLRQGAKERADYSLWFTSRKDGVFDAMLRDRVVGELRLSRGAGEAVVIENLELIEACRGRHFGQQLLGQAVSVARGQGAEQLTAVVPEDNAGARQFFLENGFAPQELEHQAMALTMQLAVPSLF